MRLNVYGLNLLLFARLILEGWLTWPLLGPLWTMSSKRLFECFMPFRALLQARKSKTLCGIKTCHGLTGQWCVRNSVRNKNSACAPLTASGQKTDAIQINSNCPIRCYSNLGKITKLTAMLDFSTVLHTSVYRYKGTRHWWCWPDSIKQCGNRSYHVTRWC